MYHVIVKWIFGNNGSSFNAYSYYYSPPGLSCSRLYGTRTRKEAFLQYIALNIIAIYVDTNGPLLELQIFAVYQKLMSYIV